MSGLSAERRKELAKAGDHGPDVCDCDAYAPDSGYPDGLVCDGLAASFALIAGWLQEAERQPWRSEYFNKGREAGAADLRARVEAACARWENAIRNPVSDRAYSGGAVLHDIRAALNGGDS